MIYSSNQFKSGGLLQIQKGIQGSTGGGSRPVSPETPSFGFDPFFGIAPVPPPIGTFFTGSKVLGTGSVNVVLIKPGVFHQTILLPPFFTAGPLPFPPEQIVIQPVFGINRRPHWKYDMGRRGK